MKSYYTVEQIASLLEMHPKTIQRYIREGKLLAHKVGKSWRIHGHDLSIFVEGKSGSQRENEVNRFWPKVEGDQVKVSAVADVAVSSLDEGTHVVNMLNAGMNSKPSEYGISSMNVQFIEAEGIVRIMLWGSARFIQVMMESLSWLMEKKQ